MFLSPNLQPLAEPHRSLRLNSYLTALNQDPSLRDFRALIEAPSDRQLALIAALERATIVGSPKINPPSPDNLADQLLCDILDTLDRPELATHGAAYGSERHLATLQALGCWRGREPLTRPSAYELFTTRFAALTALPETTSPSPLTNLSPPPQDSSPNGELIAYPPQHASSKAQPQTTLQVTIIPELAPGEALSTSAPNRALTPRISHHQPGNPGEQLPRPVNRRVHAAQPPNEAEAPLDEPEIISPRPIRRGRPLALDDLAKGRILGLLAYGLSFRQAAAQLRIHHVTILNTMKRDEDFAQQVAEAQHDALSQPLITIVRTSRTSWRAAAWLASFLDERQRRPSPSTPEERDSAGWQSRP